MDGIDPGLLKIKYKKFYKKYLPAYFYKKYLPAGRYDFLKFSKRNIKWTRSVYMSYGLVQLFNIFWGCDFERT